MFAAATQFLVVQAHVKIPYKVTVESGGSIFCLVFSLLLLFVHMDCSEILSCDRSCFLFLLSTP